MRSCLIPLDKFRIAFDDADYEFEYYEDSDYDDYNYDYDYDDPSLYGSLVADDSGSIGSNERYTWTFSPSISGAYQIAVIGYDSLDPTLSVYENGEEVGFNDDGPGSLDSALSIYLESSSTYEIVVKDYNSYGGSFDIEIYDS